MPSQLCDWAGHRTSLSFGASIWKRADGPGTRWPSVLATGVPGGVQGLEPTLCLSRSPLGTGHGPVGSAKASGAGQGPERPTQLQGGAPRVSFHPDPFLVLVIRWLAQRAGRFS